MDRPAGDSTAGLAAGRGTLSAMSGTESHWTDPGPVPVAPGVHRLPLPLPNDGLRAVNVYVIETADGLVLIDGGWALDASRQALQEGLQQLGWGLADIVRFLVTHVHRDHYTQAVAIRREFGTRVELGLGERPTLELLQAPGAKPLGSQIRRLPAHGSPQLAEEISRHLGLRNVERDHWETPDAWITAGGIALDGGPVLEAVDTPGHTAGHVVFHDLAGSLLFAGDHVLPTITPSIGFEPVPTDAPLAAFLQSLALVRSRPDARLLPAHGPVTDSVHARVDELVRHHEHRLDEMAAIVGEHGPLTATGVAERVSWTRRERKLAELDPFNRMLAVFETAAHLDLLVAQGRLRLQETGELRHYAAS